MIWGKQGRRGQAGLTMMELMIALAIAVLIVVGSLVFLRYSITMADVNRDKTMATLEVQYVGFWISEDVVQAQSIEISAPHGFPLTMEWEEWGGYQSETVTYYVENMGNEDLWRLMRTLEIYQEGELVSTATSLVAEYLVPWSGAEGEGTRCYRMVYDAEYGTMKSLMVEVEARADSSQASSKYEIYPRAVVDWLPQDVDGHYAGPECTAD